MMSFTLVLVFFVIPVGLIMISDVLERQSQRGGIADRIFTIGASAYGALALVVVAFMLLAAMAIGQH